MAQVTCPACGAELEIDAPAGTEFDCGGCGATALMPDVAPAAPRGVAPRSSAPRPSAPAPRGGAAPKGGARRSAPSGARGGATTDAAAKKQKMIVFGALGVVLLAIVVAAIISSGGDVEAPPKPPPGPPTAVPGPSPKVAAQDPPKPVEKPQEKPKPKKRGPKPNDLVDPLGALRWDMEAENAKPDAFTAFAALATRTADEIEAEGSDEGVAKLRAEARAASEAALKIDPDHAVARDQLGFVRYDKKSVERSFGEPWMRKTFKAELEAALPDVDREMGSPPGPIWVDCKAGATKDVAIRWRELMRRSDRWRKTALDPENDRFSKAAIKGFADLEKDVGEKLKRKDIDGSSFEVFTFKPYVIYVLKDKEGGEDRIAETWIEQLEQVRDTFFLRFRRRLGLNLADFEEKGVPVLVLRTMGDYTKYKGKASGAMAHFEPWSGRLVTWAGAAARENATDDTIERSLNLTVKEIRGVVFHESTHQLVHFITRESGRHVAGGQAMWFSEGIAEYFGAHSRHWDPESGRWRYVPGKINEYRLSTLRRHRDEKNPRFALKPLEDLVDYLRTDFSSDEGTLYGDRQKTPEQMILAERGVQLAYAQGWALVYFLNEWNGGKYRDKFDLYLKGERVGQSGLSAFRKIFGNDLKAMDGEFRAMIDEILAAAAEKRIDNGMIRPRGGAASRPESSPSK